MIIRSKAPIVKARERYIKIVSCLIISLKCRYSISTLELTLNASFRDGMRLIGLLIAVKSKTVNDHWNKLVGCTSGQYHIKED